MWKVQYDKHERFRLIDPKGFESHWVGIRYPIIYEQFIGFSSYFEITNMRGLVFCLTDPHIQKVVPYVET